MPAVSVPYFILYSLRLPPSGEWGKKEFGTWGGLFYSRCPLILFRVMCLGSIRDMRAVFHGVCFSGGVPVEYIKK